MLFSNEIVFRGHPDKVCDQISDALLDAYLEQDKHSRCGIEVMGGKGKIFITGEVTSNAEVDIEKVVKDVLVDIGYSTDYEIINNLGQQSPDIALGTNDDVGGAGDQGMMFGYACSETPELLPKAMVILQELAQEYDKLVKTDKRFLPDGKAQITGRYNNDGELVCIDKFVVSYNNTEQNRKATDSLLEKLCRRIAYKYDVNIMQTIFNPTGKFLVGGFEGDAGLTGRKIVVDSYHSFASVGGGAFSGKDPSKVDRSAAYMARELAKNFVLYGGYKWCQVQLSYAIGLTQPMSIQVKTDQGYVDVPTFLYEMCTPKNMIEQLDLLNMKYQDRARFGHFGRLTNSQGKTVLY